MLLNEKQAKNKRMSYITKSALIAALYVTLTMASNIFVVMVPVQFRLSEALCILPCFTAAAVPGLFIGCILANLILGSIPLDIIFGSLATLLGAMLTRKFKNNKFLAIASPIIANTCIIPFVIAAACGLGLESMPYVFVEVFISELISAGVLGFLLYEALRKRNFNL